MRGIPISLGILLGSTYLTRISIPSLSLDFFTSGTLSPLITFSRGSPATYVNSSGYITNTSIDTPRFEYDPITLQPLGLLIEQASHNLFTYSSDLTSATWFKTSVSATSKTNSPDNTNTADIITASSTAGYLYKNPIYSGSGDKSISIFIKAGTSTRSRFILRDTTLSINRGDYTITWSSGVPSITSVAGFVLGVDTFINGWYRVKVVATNIVATNNNQIRIYPDNSVGTRNSVYWGLQTEDINVVTSYIPTTTSTVTRDADDAYISTANMQPWFNPDIGTIVVNARTPAAGIRPILTFDDGTSTNSISLLTTDIDINYSVKSSNATQANLFPGFTLANKKNTIACSYNTDSFRAAANGGDVVELFNGIVPTVTQTLIGRDSNGNYINGTIEGIVYYRDNKYNVINLVGSLDNTIYGVKWDLTSSSSTITRDAGSIGLISKTALGTTLPSGVNSFDSIYPWSNIRRCVITSDKQIIYDDDPTYTTDGSLGDVMVEIPVFNYSRYRDSGYEYRRINATGDMPHPAFIENGVILPKIYVSAYEGYISSNIMHSVSGVLPTVNILPQDLLNAATVKGSGWTLMDSRAVDMIQNLLWIEHSTRNSTDIIGHGISDMIQPRTTYFPISYADTSTNSWLTNTVLSANDQERLWPGADVLICDTLQTNIIARRKVVSVTVNSPTTGITTVIVDGPPMDVTTSMFFGGAPQTTGQTDAMSYHTGQLDRPKTITASTIPRNRLNCNKYRGIENPCGNMWHFLPDVTFSGGVMYKSNDITDYEFGKISGSYEFVTSNVPLQKGNTGGVDALWVTEMLLDDNTTSGVPYASNSIVNGSESTYFGAAHYLEDGLNLVLHGGGFDHKDRTNIATMRAWGTLNTRWYLYGGRLMWKNI